MFLPHLAPLDLLALTCQSHAPVRMPLLNDASNVVCQLRRDVPPSIRDGVLMVGPKKHLIWLRDHGTEQSPDRFSTRQRFTNAHELGHLHRHAGADHSEQMFVGLFCRIPDHQMEREANRYAGETLMPEAWLRLEAFNHPCLSYLAVRFWVSRDAMRIELARHEIVVNEAPCHSYDAHLAALLGDYRPVPFAGDRRNRDRYMDHIAHCLKKSDYDQRPIRHGWAFGGGNHRGPASSGRAVGHLPYRTRRSILNTV